jgi:hypothetical protein
LLVLAFQTRDLRADGLRHGKVATKNGEKMATGVPV